MYDSRLKRLNELLKKIYNCRKCKFFEEINENNLTYFTPDIPQYISDYSTLEKIKLMVIGINPQMPENFYEKNEIGKNIYKRWIDNGSNTLDFNTYKSIVKKHDFRNNNYAQVLTKIVNILSSKEKGLSNIVFTFNNIYEYVYWTNLSFCSSQKLSKRKISNINILCNNHTNTFNAPENELNKCLKQNYLKNIIEIIKPKIIIIFTNQIDFKTLISKLITHETEINIYKKIYTINTRNTSEICAYNHNNNIRFIITPHPKSCYSDASIQEIFKDVRDKYLYV